MKLDNKVVNNKLMDKMNKTFKRIQNNSKSFTNNKINKQISRKVYNKNRTKVNYKLINNRTKILHNQI